MGLLDTGDEIRANRLAELLNGAYTGNPNIARQGQRAGVGQRTDRFSGPALGLLGGLMGVAPDEQSGSVLDPNSARNSPLASNIGFGLGSILQMLPAAELAARGINAGAAKIGGMLGPSVDRAVTSTLNRGGMGSNLLQDLAQGTQSNATVWHGSPHKFDKFDASADSRSVGGVWTTDSKPYAEWVAGKSPDKRGNVYKVDADIKNPSVFDVMEEAKKVADELGIPPPRNPLEAQELLSGGMGWDSVVSDALHEAKGRGFDALHIKNFNDAYHSNPFETTSAYVIPNANILKILERNGRTIK